MVKPMTGQNRNRVEIWIRRGARAAMTCPNVGEFTTVSIAANCRALNTLFATICTESTRLPPSGTFLVSPRLTLEVPGPGIVLRPAFPNMPPSGTENADVLKNLDAVGSSSVTGSPL